jgi:hypothetical protein
LSNIFINKFGEKMRKKYKTWIQQLSESYISQALRENAPGTGLNLPYQTLHGQAYKRVMDADKQGISGKQLRELMDQESEAIALAYLEQGRRPSVPASHWMAKESIPNLQKMLLTHSEEEIQRSIDNNIPLAGLGKPYRIQG